MTDTEAERLARSIETREPYKSAMQIAVEEVGHEDTVIVLGQGDYPTMKHIADRDVRAANRAAALLRSQAARIAALEAELAAARDAAVQVKPLEWEDRVHGFITGSGGGHSYQIMVSRLRVYGVQGEHDGAAEFETLEAAKAAAQKDYEDRIMSALEARHV